jgi:hypothetical protein
MNPLFAIPFLVVYLIVMIPGIWKLMRPTLLLVVRALLIAAIIIVLFIVPHC